jgi:acyl-CoA reductase-like NAD-dependent aldehyde dehydrogenase
MSIHVTDEVDDASPATLVARNPATGAELARYPVTGPDEVRRHVAEVRAAQPDWAATPLKQRLERLRGWWAILARDADVWADAIRSEIGKPRAEAMADVVAMLDAVRWTVKHAASALRERRVGPGWQRWLLMGTARVRPVPYGVIGMIGTWNYPALLNAAPIAQALAAGNGVVWKPSELAAWTGSLLHDGLREAGLAPAWVRTVQGGPVVGEALVRSPIGKALFTGGITAGRRVLADLGARGVPALAELSGFDPAIVLPDAPRDATVRALTWAAFAGAGQTCVAVKRVYVVGDARPWAEALAEQARALRVGDPASPTVDVGPLITPAARDRFDAMVRAAVEAGAEILAGGRPLPGPGSFYEPTVLAADRPEPEQALAGCFGPVMIVRGVGDAVTAIDAANGSEYALAASVWGRSRRAARRVARRLAAGMVSINDAMAPAGHAMAPFGGMRASGYGRTRGAWGIAEFVQPCALFERGAGGLRPQLFPYSGKLEPLLAIYRRLLHPRVR